MGEESIYSQGGSPRVHYAALLHRCFLDMSGLIHPAQHSSVFPGP